MSDMTVETIDLDNHHRIVVEYDRDTTCPREEDYTLTGFVNVEFDPWRRSSYADIPEVHEDPTGRIAEAHERLYDHGHKRTAAWHEAREHAVLRWARIFHGLTLDYENGVNRHEGYWFVNAEGLIENWPELVPGSEEYRAKERLMIDQERESYAAWADGEVFGVALEEWVELTGKLANGDPVDNERWIQIDYIGGCYLNDEYTAQDVVMDQFETKSLSEDALNKLREGLSK